MLCLNRIAVVVIAREPFLEWLRSVDPSSRELTLPDINAEPTVYLLPECESDAGAAKLVRLFAKDIFTHALDGWWREPRHLPKSMTWPLFEKWFEWRVHSMVLDLVESKLTREEF